jgi:hypothetical protein
MGRDSKEIDIHNHVVRTAFQKFPMTLYREDASHTGPDHPGFATTEVVDEEDLLDAKDEGWSEHADLVKPVIDSRAARRQARQARAPRAAAPAPEPIADEADGDEGDGEAAQAEAPKAAARNKRKR